MDLQQNTATKLSVLVYLDGDKVDNSMVANAAESITGSLNLQFKSSATLVPMQNSTLKQGKTNAYPAASPPGRGQPRPMGGCGGQTIVLRKKRHGSPWNGTGNTAVLPGAVFTAAALCGSSKGRSRV